MVQELSLPSLLRMQAADAAHLVTAPSGVQPLEAQAPKNGVRVQAGPRPRATLQAHAPAQSTACAACGEQLLLRQRATPGRLRGGGGACSRVLPPQVRDLWKEYSTKARGLFVAARGVSLDIEANSITALVGPSGSGAWPASRWTSPSTRVCQGTLRLSSRTGHITPARHPSKQWRMVQARRRCCGSSPAWRRPPPARSCLTVRVPARVPHQPVPCPPCRALGAGPLLPRAELRRRARAADTDATDISVQDRRIGFVFQSYALFQHMTCAENITFGPRMKHLDVDMGARCAALGRRACLATARAG